VSYFNTPRAFCDESDGSPVFDGSATVLGFAPQGGVYTINRPLLCNKLSVTGTAVLRMTNGSNSSDFFCARWLYVEVGASVLWSGNDATGATGGGGVSAGGSLNTQSGSGGNGGANAPGAGGTGPGGNSMGGGGGPGGNGGGNGGGTGYSAPTLTTTQQMGFRSQSYGSVGFRIFNGNSVLSVNGSGGGGGGGGQNNTGTGTGGGGGGGAPSGACRVGVWEVYGKVGCPGGKGGNGAATGNGVAGGGGSGSGGSLWVECDVVVSKGTVTVASGPFGNGAGGGANGSAGANGTLVFLVAGHAG
jgi:hypothetical protein